MTDLHTHTQASDGDLTIEDLLRRYTAQGIKLGASDHLFRGRLETHEGISEYLSELEKLSVYRGCEIDLGDERLLSDSLEERFQYRILSAHYVWLPDGSFYSFEPYFAYRGDGVGAYQNNVQKCSAKRVLDRLLAAYEIDLKRRRVDILGHCTASPFHEALLDDPFLNAWEDALLELCETYCVALEINSLWKSPGLRMIRKAADRGIKLSCGSDCHHARQTADLAYVTDMVRQAGLTAEQFFQP